MFAPYDDIAHEYYNLFHKTSRNFDQATRSAIAELSVTLPNDGLVLDVGCGSGRAAEFFGLSSQRIVCLDSSRNMLSLVPHDQCKLRVWHQAESLPLVDNEFACIVAFLCDPFWGLEFLSECYRVLEPGGLLIATLPDFEWGQALRPTLNLETSFTRFKLETGGEVKIPSNLTPPSQINQMLKTVGFNREPSISRHKLPRNVVKDRISEDIVKAAEKLNLGVYDIPILTLMRIFK